MKRVEEMKISWVKDVFNIDGEEFTGTAATSEELKELRNGGFADEEPCGQKICYKGWVWVLIDAPSGQGCQWYKTNARCNE